MVFGFPARRSAAETGGSYRSVRTNGPKQLVNHVRFLVYGFLFLVLIDQWEIMDLSNS